MQLIPVLIAVKNLRGVKAMLAGASDCDAGASSGGLLADKVLRPGDVIGPLHGARTFTTAITIGVCS